MSQQHVSIRQNILHPSRSLGAAEIGIGLAAMVGVDILEHKVEDYSNVGGGSADQISELKHDNQVIAKIQLDAHVSGNYSAEAFLRGESAHNDQLIASVQAHHPGVREGTAMDNIVLPAQDISAMVGGVLMVAAIATAVQRRR
jgi:hypothetical protein